MYPPPEQWQLKPQITPPDWLIDQVKARSPGCTGRFAAQVLWQRGLRDPEAVRAFLDPDHYQPASPWDFGLEMEQAVVRLQQARDRQEQVYIWGDFDADGITATAVLWEGLGQFLVREETLHFFIPNRLRESHGLSKAGIDAIAAQGGTLIVTCDNGSGDHAEMAYAQTLGIDVIVTDHHTIPHVRPPVVAFLNPRTLPPDHPLAHLSGVAVAYKLVEALYERCPTIPQDPVEQLLDLVAIGLIADLVKLTGDCRYLAQRGLARLKRQLDSPTRPGVAKLLELCKRTGDRPTDIAFGIGPRINAISRIHGEAREGVELLTCRDPDRAAALAESAEWTNLCRKEVQQRVTREAERQLERLDLEATPVIILSDPQWPVGVLGLVASQMAQTYGRPAILLSEAAESDPTDQPQLLRGSARSVRGIDLYQLLQQQAHLLHRFGGHPFAAGLSLPVENLPLLTASVNQTLRQQWGQLPPPSLDIDLVVTLADLVPDRGSLLFRELLLLEPYGMGHPTPRLLIRNGWLDRRRSDYSQTVRGQKLKYKKTRFELRDDTTPTAFPGVWWDHDAEDLPSGRCDVVVELEFGQRNKGQEYHARLIAVRPAEAVYPNPATDPDPWLLDWRSQPLPIPVLDPVLPLDHCPDQWEELDRWTQQARLQQHKLALAYEATDPPAAPTQWQQLAGIAKYAARTQSILSMAQLESRLTFSGRSLELGLAALQCLGFNIQRKGDALSLQSPPSDPIDEEATLVARQAVEQFLTAIAEEQFQRTYFQRASVEQLQQVLEQRVLAHTPQRQNTT
ncbi:MAG: single-stranded-DNA-specific exonuclease RecJ [Thermosynechococcaceae cyanobacterium]